MSNCHKVKVLFVQSDGGKLIIYMIKSIKRNRNLNKNLQDKKEIIDWLRWFVCFIWNSHKKWYMRSNYEFHPFKYWSLRVLKINLFRLWNCKQTNSITENIRCFYLFATMRRWKNQIVYELFIGLKCGNLYDTAYRYILIDCFCHVIIILSIPSKRYIEHNRNHSNSSSVSI